MSSRSWMKAGVELVWLRLTIQLGLDSSCKHRAGRQDPFFLLAVPPRMKDKAGARARNNSAQVNVSATENPRHPKKFLIPR